jgi:Bacterial Ig-like domain (group 3)
VTFTARVSAAGTVATGTVTFKSGSATLGSAALVDGTATFSTSALAVGKHTITAVYGGNIDLAGSTSAATESVS